MLFQSEAKKASMLTSSDFTLSFLSLTLDLLTIGEEDLGESVTFGVLELETLPTGVIKFSIGDERVEPVSDTPFAVVVGNGTALPDAEDPLDATPGRADGAVIGPTIPAAC